ncbi:hypothetical protein ZIOFF_003025 [Zingiber officinale]|uniref:FAD-binding PCMH-type domain-containing protein n=1 Tax=Zingiber officinale TaxID=94328 RepID=A0A8J5HXQ7_ZINOF|nr:hypothetical protein ZIOFF_003025 [Zingiber officinale]
MFGEFKEVMTKEFEMTDIGLMAYYLSIEVNQREDGSFISQAGYAREILKKFRMDNSKSINTPVECGVKLSKHDEEEKVDPTFFKSLVGSLRYLTCTRPDILYAVGLVSRYMEDPTTTHLKIAKRILRYIKGTIDFGLLYSTSNHFKLEGYSDSDWGGDIDDRKSTTGFVFFMGDTAFTWMSKKQPIVTLSTCEAEYVAATSCVCHAVWLRNLLNELSLPQEEATKIRTPSFIILPSVDHDSQAAVLCGRRHGIASESGVAAMTTRDSPTSPSPVGAGATLGEVYYNVAAASPTAGFPAGISPTVGVGGLISGGGIGWLQRKYGLAADNVVDVRLVNAEGELLTRETMGEDLFWAIRGGGAANFGIVVAYKLRLVPVPPKLTVFSVSRTLGQGATRLLHSWQSIAPRFADDLWIRALVIAIGEAPANRTIQATFQGLFLGSRRATLAAVKKSFPELGVRAEDCNELSWVESTLYFDDRAWNDTRGLLTRRPAFNSSFKAKSDFVREPISEKAWEGIWKVMMEGEEEPLQMIFEPWGGRLWEIEDDAIAFPHRKGNLYNIQYFMRWFETEAAVTERHLTWMRKFYEDMTPHVSSNPRAAYLNYKDIDLGSSTEEGRTSYTEASAWGRRYFLHNFEKLAKVKARVDPENYFWNEQGIPPYTA